GAARAAVDDEGVGVLRDLGIEVVHEHPQGGFLGPALAGQGRAVRRPDGAGPGKGRRRAPAAGGCHGYGVRPWNSSGPSSRLPPAEAEMRRFLSWIHVW